jgi:hypothetical protein
MGIFAEYSQLRDGATLDRPAGEYSNLWSGNLSYLSLALPLQNKLNDVLDRKQRDYTVGSAFTLMPYSTVGYNIVINEFDDNIGEIKKSFEGNGGTYQFLWSNGLRYKDVAVGLNLGYLFGKIEYARTAEFDDNIPFFNTLFTQTNKISGFLWDFGALYTLKLNKVDENNKSAFVPKKITFGIHGHSKTSFNTRTSTFQGAVQNGTGVVDTLGIVGDSISYSGTLPSELGFGATYFNGEKFALGINYTTTKWSQFESNFVNNSLNNVYKLSFGGYYRPNYKSISSYLSRVYYRFGFHYNQVPNEIPENQSSTIKDVGVSFGVGLPFFYQRKISHANLGLTFGTLGKGTAVEEKYFKILFSFTFNDDEWFLKRKYN